MKNTKQIIICALAAFAFASGCKHWDAIKDKLLPSLPAEDPDPAPAAPAQPAPADPAQPQKNAADAIAFSSLMWTVGGQSKVGDRAITIGWTGGATFNNSGCSFALPSYNGASAYTGGGSDAPYIFCVFLPDGRGGKIDWVGGGRKTRDFKHITESGNYNGWHSLESAVHAADTLYFVIIGGNGRSPIIEAKRK